MTLRIPTIPEEARNHSDGPSTGLSLPQPTLPLLAEAIVAAIPQPLLVLDSGMVVRAANPAFCDAFQAPPGEVLGRPIANILAGVFGVPALLWLMQRVIPADAPMEAFEVDDEFPRLGRRTLVIDARRIASAPDRPHLILLTFEDISERRATERRAAAAAEELLRSNRDLEDLAAAASHDLQEPLRKIRAFGELLAQDCGAQLDGTARGYLGRMLDAAGRMQALIDDLLSYARVATQPRPSQRVDLNRVASEVLVDLEAQVSRAGARVELGELPTISADPAQMRQLLQNLIGNALKFHREGEPPVVRVFDPDAGAPGMKARKIAVRDEGIGFEPKFAEKIFGLFERLHGRSAYEGTGVGLALCRRIVQRAGGTIHATGTPGRGATFVVEMPVGGKGEGFGDA